MWYRAINDRFAHPDPQLDCYYEVLSAAERERAARFLVESPRTLFVSTRATLRMVLGSYLDQPPATIEFAYPAQGKPVLAGEITDLRFNVSHTHGLAALAFTRGCEIGVDVEQLRPECEAGQLAERFFSQEERRALSGLSGPSLQQAFFRCWTRKEAYVKAKGGGLSIPLDQFDVSVADGDPATLLSTRPDPGEADRWMLHDLPVPAGYAGALAVSVSAEGRKPLLQDVDVPNFASF